VLDDTVLEYMERNRSSEEEGPTKTGRMILSINLLNLNFDSKIAFYLYTSHK